jgi:hypothetical protein
MLKSQPTSNPKNPDKHKTMYRCRLSQFFIQMKPGGSLQARDKIGKKLGYCDREGGAQQTVLKFLVFQMPCASPLAVMDGLFRRLENECFR